MRNKAISYPPPLCTPLILRLHIRRKPHVTPSPGVSLAAVGEVLGKVLVVDDDEVIRQLIAVNLTLEGFDVEQATDGQDCLERVLDVMPDVITLDVMMPHLDGWVTATRLRTDEETRHIRVVLITARAQDDDKRRGLGVGVDAYLTKPFDPAELIQIVRDLAAMGPERKRV
ncbi:MAG: response regulator [Thermoactinospora sp.]|nr:response regulator [Thermoactinospora sp.]